MNEKEIEELKKIIENKNNPFWLCYMAERDLDKPLRDSWQLSKKVYPTDTNILEKLCNKYKIKIEKVDIDNDNYLPDKITFGDRIAIYEAMIGKTKQTKILWKLKSIRDAVSHGRLSGLTYNGRDLYQRNTQEELLLDYFKSCLEENDLSKSKIWNDLSEEDKKEINEKFEEIIGNFNEK